jgi:hypothetical protein
MATPSRRRWYRRATWITVGAILIWGFTTRPYLRLYSPPNRSVNFSVLPTAVLLAIDEAERNAIPGLVFHVDNGKGVANKYALNPRLRLPAAALIALLAWRGLWAFVNWRLTLRRTLGI